MQSVESSSFEGENMNNSDMKTNVKKSYNFIPGNVKLSCSRIGDIIDESAEKYGDGVAVISAFQNISKTYAEFRYEVKKLASGLLSIGLRKGDKVAICAPNCYEWLLTQFAAAKIGIILVTIDPEIQIAELENYLNKIECKVLIIRDKMLTENYYKIQFGNPDFPDSSPIKLRKNMLPNVENIVMISNDDNDEMLNFKDVLDSGNNDSDKMLSEIEELVQFDDIACIQLTSGTTGAPKGAILTHHNLVNNAICTGRKFGYDIEKPIVCCQIQQYHSYGFVHASLATICYQGTIVFPSPTFHAISSLKAIENHKCSVIFGSPTFYIDIIRTYLCGNFNIRSLKIVGLSGAAPSSSVVKDIKEILGIPKVSIAYGTTEIGPVITNEISTGNFEMTFEFMVPVKNVEIKIVDRKGQVVPVNTQGELCSRGCNMFLGYWNDEKKTAKAIDQARWYHTGDLAVMNEEGFVKIVGRINDMIIHGGVNIYPVEIENLLNSHPSILDAHVCGVPDARMGEEACAWICLKDSKNLTEEEVKEFCRGKMSPNKIPRYIMFVETFPKTVTGKVKKSEMLKISTEKLNL